MNTDKLLKLLVCPACRGPLLLEKKEGKEAGFFCESCQLLYPIENDIPVMLIDRAIPAAAWRGEDK